MWRGVEKKAKLCKIFLAKRLAWVYIDKANTLFVVMKIKSLLLLLGAVLLAAAPGAYAESDWATTANQVAFSLDLKSATSLNISPLRGVEGLPGVEDIFKDAKMSRLQQSGMKADKDKTPTWYMLNIPVHVYAMGRNLNKKLAPARFIRELNVTAYLLFKKPKSVLDKEKANSQREPSGYYMLKKEITYADIPMNPVTHKGDRERGEATFNVALFIPRSTASMLTDSYSIATDPPIDKLLVGYAVVASVNGEPCSDFTPSGSTKLAQGETRNSKIFDKELASRVSSSSWWKTTGRTKFDEPDVDICSIAETPYALFYSGRYYPRVKPAFGSVPQETPSSADSEEGSTGSSSSSSSPSKRRSSTTTSDSTDTSPSSTTESYDSSL